MDLWINGWNGLTDDFFEALFYPRKQHKTQKNVNVAMYDAWSLARLFQFKEVDQDDDTITLQLFPFSYGEGSGNDENRKSVLLGHIGRIPIYLPQRRWLDQLQEYKNIKTSEQDKDTIPNEVFENFGELVPSSTRQNRILTETFVAEKNKTSFTTYINKIYRKLQSKNILLLSKIKVDKYLVKRLQQFANLQDQAYNAGLKSISHKTEFYKNLKALKPKTMYFSIITQSGFTKTDERFDMNGKQYVVFVGKRGGKYIKKGVEFISLKRFCRT
jgi:hypothetical protein